MRKIILTIGLIVLMTPGFLYAADVTINHEAVQCIVISEFPMMDAGFQPAPADTPRVYFKAMGSAEWYYVEMAREATDNWQGVLPKPSAVTTGVDYYIQGDAASGLSSKTPEYHPIVSTRTYCQNKGMTVTESSDDENLKLIIFMVKHGQKLIPEGFLADGISAVGLPDGTFESLTQSTTTTMTAASASAGASTGGGFGTAAAWIAGGVVVAGGGYWAYDEYGKEEEDEEEADADCDDAQQSGSDNPVSLDVNLGQKSGTFQFYWSNGGSIPDRMRIYYEGRLLRDIGCTAGTGSVYINYSGNSRIVTVEVDPNCDGTPPGSTLWMFIVYCPE